MPAFGVGEPEAPTWRDLCVSNRLLSRSDKAVSAKVAAARRSTAALRVYETSTPTWSLSLGPFPSGGRRVFTVDGAHLRRAFTARIYRRKQKQQGRGGTSICYAGLGMEGTSTCQAELGVEGSSIATKAGCGITVVLGVELPS